jgi:hypothetical protein
MSERPEPSPLGRYDDSASGDALHEVRLIGVPVRVLVAGRQHHDELMHEFSVLAVAEGSRADVPQRMLDLIETLGTRYAGATERPDAEVDAAFARGDDRVDLTYHVSAHVVDAADRLSTLMAEADDFCRREQMLTLERSEVMRDFARWYLDEFRRQINGEPARPWDGPIEP